MNRRILLFLVFIFVILIVSCVKYDDADDNNQEHPIITPFPEREKQKIVLYFPNIDTEYLTSEVREVELDNQRIEEIVVNELIKGTNRKGLKSLIPKETKLLSIDIVGEVAYVNFSEDLIKREVSEREEALILYSIVNTVNKIENVKKTQILINGNYKQVLFKYYKISEPLSTSTFIINKEYKSPIRTISRFYDYLINNDYKKASELFYLEDTPNVKFTTIKSYFENSFAELSGFKIKDYIIEKYDDKVEVRLKSEMYFYNNMVKKENEETYNLIYKNGIFMINAIL